MRSRRKDRGVASADAAPALLTTLESIRKAFQHLRHASLPVPFTAIQLPRPAAAGEEIQVQSDVTGAGGEPFSWGPAVAAAVVEGLGLSLFRQGAMQALLIAADHQQQSGKGSTSQIVSAANEGSSSTISSWAPSLERILTACGDATPTNPSAVRLAMVVDVIAGMIAPLSHPPTAVDSSATPASQNGERRRPPPNKTASDVEGSVELANTAVGQGCPRALIMLLRLCTRAEALVAAASVDHHWDLVEQHQQKQQKAKLAEIVAATVQQQQANDTNLNTADTATSHQITTPASATTANDDEDPTALSELSMPPALKQRILVWLCSVKAWALTRCGLWSAALRALAALTDEGADVDNESATVKLPQSPATNTTDTAAPPSNAVVRGLWRRCLLGALRFCHALDVTSAVVGNATTDSNSTQQQSSDTTAAIAAARERALTTWLGPSSEGGGAVLLHRDVLGPLALLAPPGNERRAIEGLSNVLGQIATALTLRGRLSSALRAVTSRCATAVAERSRLLAAARGAATAEDAEELAREASISARGLAAEIARCCSAVATTLQDTMKLATLSAALAHSSTVVCDDASYTSHAARELQRKAALTTLTLTMRSALLIAVHAVASRRKPTFSSSLRGDGGSTPERGNDSTPQRSPNKVQSTNHSACTPMDWVSLVLAQMARSDSGSSVGNAQPLPSSTGLYHICDAIRRMCMAVVMASTPTFSEKVDPVDRPHHSSTPAAETHRHRLQLASPEVVDVALTAHIADAWGALAALRDNNDTSQNVAAARSPMSRESPMRQGRTALLHRYGGASGRSLEGPNLTSSLTAADTVTAPMPYRLPVTTAAPNPSLLSSNETPNAGNNNNIITATTEWWMRVLTNDGTQRMTAPTTATAQPSLDVKAAAQQLDAVAHGAITSGLSDTFVSAEEIFRRIVFGPPAEKGFLGLKELIASTAAHLQFEDFSSARDDIDNGDNESKLALLHHTLGGALSISALLRPMQLLWVATATVGSRHTDAGASVLSGENSSTAAGAVWTHAISPVLVRAVVSLRPVTVTTMQSVAAMAGAPPPRAVVPSASQTTARAIALPLTPEINRSYDEASRAMVPTPPPPRFSSPQVTSQLSPQTSLPHPYELHFTPCSGIVPVGTPVRISLYRQRATSIVGAAAAGEGEVITALKRVKDPAASHLQLYVCQPAAATTGTRQEMVLLRWDWSNPVMLRLPGNSTGSHSPTSSPSRDRVPSAPTPEVAAGRWVTIAAVVVDPALAAQDRGEKPDALKGVVAAAHVRLLVMPSS